MSDSARGVRLTRAGVLLEEGGLVEEGPQVAALGLFEAARHAGELVCVCQFAGCRGGGPQAGPESILAGAGLLEGAGDQRSDRPQRRVGSLPLHEITEARERELIRAREPELRSRPQSQLEGARPSLLGPEREQREPVPRDLAERAGQSRVEGELVEGVGEHTQVAEEVFDRPALPVGARGGQRREPLLLQGALVHRDVAERAQQHRHVAAADLPAGHQLRHPAGQQARLGVAPGRRARQPGGERVPVGVCPSELAGQQQLDRHVLAVPIVLAAAARRALKPSMRS